LFTINLNINNKNKRDTLPIYNGRHHAYHFNLLGFVPASF